MKQAYFYSNRTWQANYPDPLQEMAEIAKKAKLNLPLTLTHASIKDRGLHQERSWSK